MGISTNVKRKISTVMEMPKELILNLPLITLIGNEEINIENYKGIIEYTEEKIRISASCGILRIEGRNLKLKQVTTENILITGGITKIEFIA